MVASLSRAVKKELYTGPMSLYDEHELFGSVSDSDDDAHIRAARTNGFDHLIRWKSISMTSR